MPKQKKLPPGWLSLKESAAYLSYSAYWFSILRRAGYWKDHNVRGRRIYYTRTQLDKGLRQYERDRKRPDNIERKVRGAHAGVI